MDHGVTKIISGGQTGADQGGLYAADLLGIDTGGWAPKGWRTEKGAMKDILQGFGLKECNVPGYPVRTESNIFDCDGTVIFGRLSSSGSKLTVKLSVEHKKPMHHIDVPWNYHFIDRKRGFMEWLKMYKIGVLNVAGNRESVNKGIGERVMEFLIQVLG